MAAEAEDSRETLEFESRNKGLRRRALASVCNPLSMVTYGGRLSSTARENRAAQDNNIWARRKRQRRCRCRLFGAQLRHCEAVTIGRSVEIDKKATGTDVHTSHSGSHTTRSLRVSSS